MSDSEFPCLSRRNFLIAGGAGAAIVTLGELFPGSVLAGDAGVKMWFSPYPRKKIAKLSELKQDKPVEFRYPDGKPNSASTLVKLGTRAGGGIGPEQDVVAFNTLCTHQGWSLRGAYNAEYKLQGPCAIHLSTFDLTRHGIVVSGHATENLPQVVLELEGDDIVAVGVLGQIYGYPDNQAFTE